MKTLIWTSILVGTISLAATGCLGSEDESAADTEEGQTEDAVTVTVLNLPAGCTVRADAPTYSAGIISAKAGISCSSAHNLWIRAGIYENGGSILRTTTNTCNSARTCSATATWTNRAGNQTWCTRGEGDSNPPSNPTIVRACETAGF